MDQTTLFEIHCELYRIFTSLSYIQKVHVPHGSEDIDRALHSLFRIKEILDEKEKEYRLPLNVVEGKKSRGIQFMMENTGQRAAV